MLEIKTTEADTSAKIIVIGGEELIEKCGNALKTALRDTSFELGFNGEKYELILSPEGLDRKSTRLNSSHVRTSRMPSSA